MIGRGSPARLLSDNDIDPAARPQADRHAADYPCYLGGRSPADGPPGLLPATKGSAQIWV